MGDLLGQERLKSVSKADSLFLIGYTLSQKFRVAVQPTENLIFKGKNPKFTDNFGNKFNDLGITMLVALKRKTYEQFQYSILKRVMGL